MENELQPGAIAGILVNIDEKVAHIYVESTGVGFLEIVAVRLLLIDIVKSSHHRHHFSELCIPYSLCG